MQCREVGKEKEEREKVLGKLDNYSSLSQPAGGLVTLLVGGKREV